MKKLWVSFVIGFFILLSRLPLRVLYIFSDVFYPILYYVARYRRVIVRRNLVNSFPELSKKEILRIEHRFYRFFCDYSVETVKMLTISAKEMKRRLRVEGCEEVERQLKTHDLCFIYLGHYGNWEWISSLKLWINDKDIHAAQIYRPLSDKVFDALFYRLRTRFGAENISKYETLRDIVRMKRDKQKTVVGFISDQSPHLETVHEWTTFLNQDTGVFTGTERIGKRVDAAVFFADMVRVRRGYYKLELQLMTDDIQSIKDYELTEAYMREMERVIRRDPAIWLWSHNRWKLGARVGS